VCHSYSDFNFGVTFLEHSVYVAYRISGRMSICVRYKETMRTKLYTLSERNTSVCQRRCFNSRNVHVV